MGQRIETWKDGVLVHVKDDREIEDEKQKKIAELKEFCEREILTLAPVHKQMNIANGILGGVEKDMVLNHIVACRIKYETVKQQVLNAKTFEDIEAVLWETAK